MTKIFLTGITGLVGSAFAVALLRKRQDCKIVTLARKSSVKSAQKRVEDIIIDQCKFDNCSEIAPDILKFIEVIEGDVTEIEPQKLASDEMLQGVSVIFHCAADVNLGKDLDGKTYRINHNGTERMLEIAKLLKAKEFHYVSTAYVAGKLKGRAMECQATDSGFNNSYEKSKFDSELLVRNAGIPYSIYRPSIIIGRLSDGRIRKPLAFYTILEFMAKLKKHRCAKLKLDPLGWVDLDVRFQAIPSEHVYFVPIDYVQSAITALFQKPVCNKTYHITGNSPVSTQLIDQMICKVLKVRGVYVEGEASTANMDEKLMSRFLGDLLPYFSSDIIFDQSNVKDVLGPEALNWEVGERGLHVMMASFFKDYFPNVDWVQKVIQS
ncbi:MAG: SDR family oxidoreductase [Victivallaceae bacterium]